MGAVDSLSSLKSDDKEGEGQAACSIVSQIEESPVVLYFSLGFVVPGVFHKAFQGTIAEDGGRTCTYAKVSYASAIENLMYVMVSTRPDIAQAVGMVSRYMNNLGKVHWEAVKWILRYLRGTTNKALCFKGGDAILTSYVDADLAENVDVRKSTTWYMYTLGGTTVSWVSQLQKIVALSTTETEYMAVTEASKEMVWLQGFLEELGKKQLDNILYRDRAECNPSSKEFVFSFQNETHSVAVSFYPITS